MTSPRVYSTATLLSSGDVLLVHGTTSASDRSAVYHPTTNTWTSIAPGLHSQRAKHAATGPSPEDTVIAAETHAEVRAAAGALTGRRRLLVDVLFFQPPQSYEEVARRTGMPLGSIGPTRRRTLQELHQRLCSPAPVASPARAA